MSNILQLSRTIHMPLWNEGMQERVMVYWRERGFSFSETDGDFLKATRGSMWGNLTALNPRKIQATLSVARTSPSELLCLLEIDTRFQMILEWDIRYWEMELETLESYLFRNDTRDLIWQEFERDGARALALWIATAGILGRRLPDRWKQK